VKKTPGREALAQLIEDNLESSGGSTSTTVAMGLVDLLVDTDHGQRALGRASTERAREQFGGILRKLADAVHPGEDRP
jgi:hypothetical protein